MSHTPRDPGFAERVRASFGKQQFMTTLGATLERVEPGDVAITLAFRPELSQQHGYLHAGVIASVVDSACGYAALSLMDVGHGVVSVEFKINMMAPAVGVRFRADGRVVRAGRTLTVCSGEAHAIRDDGSEAVVAMMQATMMAIRE